MSTGQQTNRGALVGLLLASAVLMAWGIWRTAPHQLLGDEASVVARSLYMAFHGPWTRHFHRGGNLHLWVLLLADVPVLLVWASTGRFDFMADATAVYAHRKVWTDGPLLAGFTDALLAARAVSVVFGVVTIYLVYRLACELSDRQAGLWAGSILAVSMGFVLTAKYATEDVPQAALIVFALWLLVRAAGDWDQLTVVYAALVTGLAMGMKATSGLLVVPFGVVLVDHYGGRGRAMARQAGLTSSLAAGAYLLSTPSLLAHPREWVYYLLTYVGWFTDKQGILNHYPDPGWITAGAHLAVALSFPLFVVGVLAWVGVGYWTLRGRVDPRVGLLYSFAIPYGLMLGIGRLTSYFRVVPLVPLTAVVVAVAMHHLAGSDRPWRQWAGRTVLAVVVMFAAVYTGTAAASFGTTRGHATEVVADLPAESDVAVFAHRIYLPRFSQDVRVHRYRGALERGEAGRKRALADFRASCYEYVVLSSFHYFRYVRTPDWHPQVAATMMRLLSEDGEYRITDRIGPPVVTDYDAARKLRESVTLVHRARTNNNPTVVILERRGGCP